MPLRKRCRQRSAVLRCTPQRGRSLAKRLGRHQRPAGTEPFVFLAQSGQGGSRQSVEAAIDLAGIVGHVTLVEFDTALRADAVPQRKLNSLANVTVFTNAQTTEITGDAQKVNGLVYKDRASGQSHTVALEGVFIQIGLVPNTDWLKGTVELSKHGEIVVDARGQTSVPGVFAAGDVTTVPFKQIIIAAGDGAKAALSAFDHLIRTSAPAA